MRKKTLAGRDQVVTGTITFDKFDYDDSESSGWRKLKRAATCLLVIGLVLGLSWATFGTPYVRWDEPLADGKDGSVLSRDALAFTRYVGFGGSRRVHAGEYGEGLPWLIFIPFHDTVDGDCSAGACPSDEPPPEAYTPSPKPDGHTSAPHPTTGANQ